MNTDVDSMLKDDYMKECFMLEAILQNVLMGYHFDHADVKNNFKYEKWYNVFCDHMKKYSGTE